MGDAGAAVSPHAAKHRRAENDTRIVAEPKACHAAVLDSDRRLPALITAFLAATVIDPQTVELGHRHVKRSRHVNGHDDEICWTEREEVTASGHIVWDEDAAPEESTYGARLIRARAVVVAVDGRVYARLGIPPTPTRPSTSTHADFLPGLHVEFEQDAHVWVWRDDPAPAGAIAFHVSGENGPTLGVEAVDATERWLLDRMADYLTETNPAVQRRRPGARPRPR